MTDVNNSEAPAEPVGERVDVSREIPGNPKQVWATMMSTEGADAFLGSGAVWGDKGHLWRTDGGRSGIIRSVHPNEEIRFSVRRDDDAPPSHVEILLAPSGDATTVDIHHTEITSGSDPAELERKWSQALDTLASSQASA